MTWAIRPLATPGRQVLNELGAGRLCSYQQSVRVVELLEKQGKGLNLT